MSNRAMGLGWLQGLGITIGSVIALYTNSSVAQITPDGTLPNNSSVRLDGTTRVIEGGTQASGNLFHSFKDFSVPNGSEAFFNNTVDIQNIISRVTGKSISNIDGLIKANGVANLFLINPNGIIFGQNARLDIGGSFIATSANSMKFADGSEFSATNPQSTPLLTINVPVGLQLGANPGSIEVNSGNLQTKPGETLALIGGNISIDGGKLVAHKGHVELGGVKSGSVALFANDNNFNLNFPQGVPRGNVFLTNQAEVNVIADNSGGSIGINAANLNMSGGSQLLTGISGIGSSATQAGNININATGIVALTDGSKISNEVKQNAVGNSGNVNLNAGSVSLSHGSLLASSTAGWGNAGNVTIKTDSLSLFDGSFLAASANGQGNAGNINIEARDNISFDRASRAYTDVTVKGDGGNINIITGSLSVTNDSFLASSTKGEGNSGSINIKAGNSVLFNNGRAYTDVGNNGKGKGGNFNITAQSLELTNGAQLVASTQNQGNAGNITINTGKISVTNKSFLAASANGQQGNAGNININATNTVTFNEGSAYANVTGTGDAGNINITTNSLAVSNQSQLAASANGRGNAGNIAIQASDRVSFDKSQAFTNVTEKGNGGDINITSESVFLTNGSYLMASTNGTGNAGNLKFNTGSLFVTDDSFLAASANGEQGNAGNITINARDTVSFDRRGRAYSDVTGKGDGGDINIITGSLSVTNDSFLASSTKGEGNSGSINIKAANSVLFNNGQANTDVGNNGKGKGGNFNITAQSLELTNGAQLLASTKNQGNAGNITINTGEISVTNKSFLAASANGQQSNAGNININATNTATFNEGSAYANVTGTGDAGNINITTNSLAVSNQSQLAASANGRGNAGNIAIQASDRVSFDKSQAFTNVTEKGNGGDINITSESVSLTNGSYLMASTSGNGNAGNLKFNTGSLFVTNESFLAASANGEQGNAGNININARDTVSFDRGGRAYSDVTGKGDGGEIKVKTESLSITNGSQVSASTSGVGNAGNFIFDTGSFAVTNNSQMTTSTSGVGNAGNIAINTDSLSVTNESFLASSANGRGNAGNIVINARKDVSFDNGAKVYTDVNQLPFSDNTKVKGDGGNIEISSESLFVTNGAQLISNTQGEGNAGNITINTGDLNITNQAFLASSANGQQGSAGDIKINARNRILFDKGSAFSNVGVCSLIAVGCTQSNNTIQGNGGDIIIKAPSLQLVNNSFLATGVGEDDLTSSQINGNGGNISIHLQNDLFLDKSFITSRLFANGKGKAGDIDIRADSVSSYQSLISASSQGQGNAGGVSIQARGAISLVDSDISTAVQGAIGDAQGINITARSLSLTDGAQLNAVTSGAGNAGNVFINTTDINVSGTNTTASGTNLLENNIPPRFNSPPKFVDGVSSGIFTITNSSGIGGDITVNTNTFSISNGAVVDARTTASNRGGAIKINTNTFEATSGGQLTAITSGSGTAGNINLNVTGTAIVEGSDSAYLARLAQFNNGADIDIYGKQKVGNQGATSGLTVSSTGTGSAGDLVIKANYTRLDNGAKISADTTGGGGNIKLLTPLLVLRRGTSITTNADGINNRGGNINIDATKNGFIVAVENENTDIRADSAQSRGGNVFINARKVFGIQRRDVPSPFTSDITAKGATPELTGTVEITTPDVDPTNGLVELPINLVDASRQISNACTPGTRQFENTFVATGRGGLPASPTEPLQDLSTSNAWVILKDKPETKITEIEPQPTVISNTPKVPTTLIVEATNWIVSSNGNIELVAPPNQTNPHSPWQTASCQN